MFKVFRDAWRIPDLRKKILFTILMMAVYRLVCYIPTPGVAMDFVRETVNSYEALSFVNLLSGNALQNMTVGALGISPYINASIIMNLLTVAIPPLERMSKEEDGRKKIAAITRYAAVGLGLVSALGILLGLGDEAVLGGGSWFAKAVIVLCLTAGTAMIMWIGEKITDKGIGNGISLIIFTSIVSQLPTQAISYVSSAAAGYTPWWTLVAVVVIVIAMTMAVTLVDMGERRIPVQYAKRVIGRKMYGGQSTYLPMKLNSSGVLPLIFAMTILSFPGMIANFWPQSDFYLWWSTYMASGTWLYTLLYALLILFFTYFYTQISFNPADVSKNMQGNGGFIPGIRPGKPTTDYLKRILNRLTLFGAVFLAVIAVVPTLLQLANINMLFASTSLLIMVSVALETAKQIESQMMMRHYKGFLS